MITKANNKILFSDIKRAQTFIQNDCSYKWFTTNVKLTSTTITIGNKTGELGKCTIIHRSTNDFTLEDIDLTPESELTEEKLKEYEKLEKEFLGDPDKKTGIYAEHTTRCGSLP